MLPHPALGLIWDPANMAVLGGRPFPDGYSHLPVERLLHVHVKDCTVDNFVPTWQPVGTNIDWRGQVAALMRDGYMGSFSLETHWPGPGGLGEPAPSTGVRHRSSPVASTRKRTTASSG